MLFHNGENVPAQVIESQTSQGIANGNLVIDQSGEINIRAESGQALSSDVISLEIPPESVTLTPPPSTQTPVPTLTPTSSPTSTATATPSATAIPVNVMNVANVDFADWLFALILVAIVSGINYWIMLSKRGLRWGVRAALLPVIGGLITYTYLAVGLPGSESMTQTMGTWGILLVTLAGAAMGVIATLIWQLAEDRKIKFA